MKGAHAPSAPSTLLNDLVAFWRLDEASGTRNDSAGANHLTDNNTVTQAVGKVGNAAQFTAANSEYLSRVDNAALSMGDIDFTIAAWVYVDARDADRTIVAKRNTTADLRIEYLLRANSVNQFEFYISDDGGANFNVVQTATGTVVVGAWHFLVAWHEAAANTIKIQLDNATPISAATTLSPVDTTHPLTIGGFAGGQFWDGRGDATGIWKRALTADERTELWNGGAGVEYPF